MNAPVEPYLRTYREQLDRVRRSHARLRESCGSQLRFQDIMYSFFQNCWHLKDWIMNDPKLISPVHKKALYTAAHAAGSPLRICQELCNGTKHLLQSGARPDHINTTVFLEPNRQAELDCLIEDGTGSETLISGQKLADECVAEWERILNAEGLDTSQVFFG